MLNLPAIVNIRCMHIRKECEMQDAYTVDVLNGNEKRDVGKWYVYSSFFMLPSLPFFLLSLFCYPYIVSFLFT